MEIQVLVHESAGKQPFSGRMRKGNQWLRRALCEAARAASHTKKSYFQELYSRPARHRGKNRALMAVAHSLLITVYTFTKTGIPYEDLGRDYFDPINKEAIQRGLVKRLEKVGNKVTLTPAA